MLLAVISGCRGVSTFAQAAVFCLISQPGKTKNSRMALQGLH